MEQELQESSEKPNNEQSSEESYELQHDRPNCIGCAACEAVAPDFWEMNEDGKSDIKGCDGHDAEGWQRLNISQKNFEENKEAAESCPVNVIHLVNKKTGDKII